MKPNVKVLIDIKNLALYRGGIAHWFSPLLVAWIKRRHDLSFILVGPEIDFRFLPETNNWEYKNLAWPTWLPRPLRHPFYDNILFPLMVRRISPDRIMSPYHDVRMPKNITSSICVHDLCFDELAGVYPRRIRSYYLNLLKHNLRCASSVITVSETTRKKLAERYEIKTDKVSVVYNTLPDSFMPSANPHEVRAIRSRYAKGGHLLFYAGGSEYRKNVDNLALGFSIFLEKNPLACLLVTGDSNHRWDSALEKLPKNLSAAIVFAGKLSDQELYLAYKAADAVVYPSLCEGFGRVCLEAMGTGTPLACSDLPVMHEVSEGYAHYFDPKDPISIAGAIQNAVDEGKKSAIVDPRFTRVNVEKQFLAAMSLFVGSECVSQ